MAYLLVLPSAQHARAHHPLTHTHRVFLTPNGTARPMVFSRQARAVQRSRPRLSRILRSILHPEASVNRKHTLHDGATGHGAVSRRRPLFRGPSLCRKPSLPPPHPALSPPSHWTAGIPPIRTLAHMAGAWGMSARAFPGPLELPCRWFRTRCKVGHGRSGRAATPPPLLRCCRLRCRLASRPPLILTQNAPLRCGRPRWGRVRT